MKSTLWIGFGIGYVFCVVALWSRDKHFVFCFGFFQSAFVWLISEFYFLVLIIVFLPSHVTPFFTDCKKPVACLSFRHSDLQDSHVVSYLSEIINFLLKVYIFRRFYYFKVVANRRFVTRHGRLSYVEACV